LKRPNKYLSNELIARARDWPTFLHLPETAALRDWERQKLTEFTGRIQTLARIALVVACPSFSGGEPAETHISPSDMLHAINIEFGLSDFYRDQSRKADDLDQAGDALYLEVILSLAANFDALEPFYRFVSHSTAENDSPPDDNSPDQAEGPAADQVFLSTIHKTKGKEFRNVIYFDLSQPDARIIGEEEERRVAYVGATRPKDDLLVTFQAGRPSLFLREMALNPKYKTLDPEALERALAKSRRLLEREQRVLAQMQSQREQVAARFASLVAAQPASPGWLDSLASKLHDWRIDQSQARLEKLDSAISAQRANRLAPLAEDTRDLENESSLRAALNSAAQEMPSQKA
jgi:ATP-dependent exoDNAse (exonuclease V) beta subunit